ncbi:FKBP-type peptidyl-prolyl cis-trans isomerase [Vibrio salinus]|uniref:FKBP-type peptidyl-prolyl cis-trans isomerase n=1 Tax=Vibrio salinus TaxID=2899784 RepID=UPI003563499C
MRNIRASKQAKEHILEGEAFLKENGQREGVITTSSGLQYEILEEGNGTGHPTLNSQVKVHYHGTLLNGKVFNSSVESKQAITFRLKQVIKGWQEGVQTMVVGQKTRFYIPYNLAYGKRRTGMIPPGSLLIFEISLLEIK